MNHWMRLRARTGAGRVARAGVLLAAMLAVSGTALGQGLVTESSYGASAQGRPLTMLRVTSNDAQPAGAKPGVLVVAGLDGQHVGGIEIARRIADALAGRRDLPRDTDFYIIATANPDAAARQRAGSHDRGGTLDPVDEDRDRRVDEDGPVDLNGDGVITMMRVRAPSIASGLTATHIAHPDEPRLMKRAEGGERAEYALLMESRDQDGDGRFGEDGPGFTNLDRSFPYRWPEGASDAGEYPLVHAETKGLADWLLQNPHIVAVVALGPGDDLRNLPEVGKMDRTGRVPLGIQREDEAAWKKVGEVFKKQTSLGSAPAPSREGSLHGWAYGHLGLYAWMAPVHGTPEPKADETETKPADGGEASSPEPARPSEPPAAADPRAALMQRGVPAEIAEFILASPERRAAMIAEVQSASEADQERMQQMVMGLPTDVRVELMAIIANPQRVSQFQQEVAQQPEPARAAGEARPRAQRAAQRGKLNDEQKWLAFADEQGSGFVEWTPFEHPQLGTVEIGGFVPGFTVNPPADRYDAIAAQHANFLVELSGLLPRLRVDPPEVTQTAPGVWRIRMRVVNEGDLATTTQMMVAARRLPQLAARLILSSDRVVFGERRQTLGRLEGNGGSATAEWLVLGNAGDTIEIELADPQLGTRSIDIELAEVKR